jgi:hypothetical protein
VHITRGWVLEALEALHARLARCASRAAWPLSGLVLPGCGETAAARPYSSLLPL